MACLRVEHWGPIALERCDETHMYGPHDPHSKRGREFDQAHRDAHSKLDSNSDSLFLSDLFPTLRDHGDLEHVHEEDIMTRPSPTRGKHRRERNGAHTTLIYDVALHTASTRAPDANAPDPGKSGTLRIAAIGVTTRVVRDLTPAVPSGR